MRVKQALIFILLILILVIFNRVFLNTFSRANSYFATENHYSNEIAQPNKLFEKTWKTIAREYYDTTMNHQDWSRWKTHYYGKIKTEDDAKVAIDSMVASLNEPYTRYLNQKEYNDLITSITSKIYGIGVNIYSNSGKIEIFNVIPSTPAELAGLKQGDLIIKLKSSNKKTNTSIVEITILRDGKKILKKIKRKEIKIKNVKSSVLDNHIGYIQIISFMGGTTPNEFLEALENTKKTDSLILDLRGNTGGLLNNSVFIANLFIHQGEIVEIIYRNGYKKSIVANPEQQYFNKPIVVLVNGASASASEILSGALKDYKKATIVGKKTFGKGLVQKVVPLPNKTGLNVTIARYLTPNGTDINKLGIKPDIEIGNDYDFLMNNQKDLQLEKAKDLLSKGF